MNLYRLYYKYIYDIPKDEILEINSNNYHHLKYMNKDYTNI